MVRTIDTDAPLEDHAAHARERAMRGVERLGPVCKDRRRRSSLFLIRIGPGALRKQPGDQHARPRGAAALGARGATLLIDGEGALVLSLGLIAFVLATARSFPNRSLRSLLE